MSDLALAGVIVAAGLGTYFWRAMGVVLSGRIRTDGPLFQWVGCVAYAMIAGLAVRILVLPLYPQYAGPTTGSSFDAVAKWRKDLP